MMRENSLDFIDEVEVLGMKFIKLKDGNYMIKDSNGIIVDEKEKLQLENRELVLQDIEGCNCQAETTKKITKNKKRIKELMEEEKNFIPVETYDNENIKKTKSTKN